MYKRQVYEDANVFARALHDAGVMDARDYASYATMYDAVRRALRPPDLLVYLRASLPTLRAHIAVRGRAFEQRIEDDYLVRLGRLYEAWVEAYDLSPVVVIDADRFDVVGRPADRAAVFDLLERQGLATPVVR